MILLFNSNCLTKFLTLLLFVSSNFWNNVVAQNNDCEGLNPGDIYFTMIVTDSPQRIGLLTLVDLPPILELYMTTNANNGTDFVTEESTSKLTLPAGGVSAMTSFGYGDEFLLGELWEPATFMLNNDQGDKIFLYCIASNDDPRPLAAISYNGLFQQQGLDSYDIGESALPSELVSDVIVLEFLKNYVYKRSLSAPAETIRNDIVDPKNWVGSNQEQFSFTPNTCQSFGPGDIYFLLLNSDNPDSFGLFPFVDFPAGLELYMTDNAWNGQDFIDTEGVIKLTIPEGGIPGVTTFGYGTDFLYGSDWEEVSGSFSLSTEGEQIFLYCMSSIGTPNFLVGLSYNGPFSPPGLDNYLLNESAVPETLGALGTIVLPHMDNYKYVGILFGSDVELRNAFLDPNSWEGNNEARYEFNVSPGSTSGGVKTTTTTTMTTWLSMSFLLLSLSSLL